MIKWILTYCLTLLLIFSAFAQEPENETICSKRCGYCFQIPPNHFMLSTGDIESSLATYQSVDRHASLEIIRNSLDRTNNFHALYLKTIEKWTNNDCRLTLKREEADYFIISGYTSNNRGFYQKVIKMDDEYCSLYLEFPKGEKKYFGISQMIFDHFKQSSS